jgi:hypothetical protein
VVNLRALLGYPVLDRAGRLDVPAVVVRGRRDPLVPDRFARRLAAAIPRGRYVVVDGRHALPYGMPEAVAGLVLDGVAGSVTSDHPAQRRSGDRGTGADRPRVTERVPPVE